MPLINGPTEFTNYHPVKIQWTKKPTKSCKVGDILLCVRGSSTGRINIANDQYCIGRGIAAIRAKDEIDKDFLNYVIQNVVSKIIRLTTGSTFPNIDSTSLRSIKTNIPLFLEQKAISSCLSTWDRAIQTFTQLIQQKQKRKKWLMQVLLTGRKRLPGFSKNWQNLKIRDFASEVSSRNSNDNGYKVLSCTKYDGLVPSLEYFGRKIFSDNLTTYKIVPRNHYAYATNHIEEGSIGYQFDYDFGLISPMYTVFKTDQKVNDDFLFPLLKSHQMIHEYEKRMEGSIDRRGGLRWNTFSGINILLPPKEEQTAIAKVLQTADKEIKTLNQKLELLKAQKKGLMQQLLTGRKRLIHLKNKNNA